MVLSPRIVPRPSLEEINSNFSIVLNAWRWMFLGWTTHMLCWLMPKYKQWRDRWWKYSLSNPVAKNRGTINCFIASTKLASAPIFNCKAILSTIPTNNAMVPNAKPVCCKLRFACPSHNKASPRCAIAFASRSCGEGGRLSRRKSSNRLLMRVVFCQNKGQPAAKFLVAVGHHWCNTI